MDVGEECGNWVRSKVLNAFYVLCHSGHVNESSASFGLRGDRTGIWSQGGRVDGAHDLC